jgi:hypothetical protein
MRYKRGIRPYNKGLKEIMQLKPVYYKSGMPADDDRDYAGLIAEDIDAEGFKEFVYSTTQMDAQPLSCTSI